MGYYPLSNIAMISTQAAVLSPLFVTSRTRTPSLRASQSCRPARTFQRSHRLVTKAGWALKGPSETFTLEGTKKVGAVDPVDIKLDVDTVSGSHAELVANGSLTVNDLGSTNGTFVNGQKVSTATTLNAGDEVSFGAEPVFTVVQTSDDN